MMPEAAHSTYEEIRELRSELRAQDRRIDALEKKFEVHVADANARNRSAEASRTLLQWLVTAAIAAIGAALGIYQLLTT